LYNISIDKINKFDIFILQFTRKIGRYVNKTSRKGVSQNDAKSVKKGEYALLFLFEKSK